MCEPDENGCIYIKWPSQKVPHGGILHPRKVESNTETTNFIKLLLNESKQTIAQRNSIFQLRDGNYNGKKERTSKTTDSVEDCRPKTSRRRSLSSIRQSGDLDTIQWKPNLKPGKDCERLKVELQEFMEWGSDGRPKNNDLPPLMNKKPELPNKYERRHELMDEIRERAEWLKEMEELGAAGPHRIIIRDQINERIKEITALGIFETPRSQVSTARSSRSSKSINSVNESARKTLSLRSASKNLLNTSSKNTSVRSNTSPGKPLPTGRVEDDEESIYDIFNAPKSVKSSKFSNGE